MASSQLAISNLALTLLGDKPLSSLTESSLRAEVCLSNYEGALKTALSRGPWSFATHKYTLVAAVPTPLNEWSYAYQIPTGVCRLIRVYPDSPYDIYGDQIYSNQSSLAIDAVTRSGLVTLAAQSTDSGQWYPATSYAATLFTTGGYDTGFGFVEAVACAQFTPVAIPALTTLVSATLSVKVTSVTTSGTPYLIAFQNADTSSNITSSDVTTWAAATSTVSVAKASTTGILTFDVAAILQTVFSRAGWASGNRVGVRLRANPYTAAETVLFDDTYGAILTMTYFPGTEVGLEGVIPPHFERYVAHELLTLIAYPLTGDDEKVKNSETWRAQFLGQALAIDAQQRPNKIFRSSAFIDVRRGVRR